MIRKAINRIMAAWCFYGLYLLLRVINPIATPLLIRFWGDYAGIIYKGDGYDIEDYVFAWLFTAIAIGAIFLVFAGLSYGIKCFFKEDWTEESE